MTGAVAAAARIAGPVADRRVLIVGAGRIARVAALNAASRDCRAIVIANWTFARAQELATAISARAVPLGELGGELASADVIISATGSQGFVLTAEHAAAAQTCRRGRPLVVFDLALPCDVHPAFGPPLGSRLFNLDDLALVVAESGAGRRADLERASTIVREEAARYEAWRRGRAAAPAITALHEHAEQARRHVLARHAAELARLAPADRALVEAVSRRLATKLVHASTLEIRRAVMERAA